MPSSISKGRARKHSLSAAALAESRRRRDSKGCPPTPPSSHSSSSTSTSSPYPILSLPTPTPSLNERYNFLARVTDPDLQKHAGSQKGGGVGVAGIGLRRKGVLRMKANFQLPRPPVPNAVPKWLDSVHPTTRLSLSPPHAASPSVVFARAVENDLWPEKESCGDFRTEDKRHSMGRSGIEEGRTSGVAAGSSAYKTMDQMLSSRGSFQTPSFPHLVPAVQSSPDYEFGPRVSDYSSDQLPYPTASTQRFHADVYESSNATLHTNRIAPPFSLPGPGYQLRQPQTPNHHQPSYFSTPNNQLHAHVAPSPSLPFSRPHHKGDAAYPGRPRQTTMPTIVEEEGVIQPAGGGAGLGWIRHEDRTFGGNDAQGESGRWYPHVTGSSGQSRGQNSSSPMEMDSENSPVEEVPGGRRADVSSGIGGGCGGETLDVGMLEAAAEAIAGGGENASSKGNQSPRSLRAPSPALVFRQPLTPKPNSKLKSAGCKSAHCYPPFPFLNQFQLPMNQSTSNYLRQPDDDLDSIRSFGDMEIGKSVKLAHNGTDETEYEDGDVSMTGSGSGGSFTGSQFSGRERRSVTSMSFGASVDGDAGEYGVGGMTDSSADLGFTIWQDSD